MDKYLFLDIDGALNDHSRHENGYCGLKPSCVAVFNRILRTIQSPKIVITSAWRYLVLNGSMTVKGLENVLLSHGLNCRNLIHGITRADISEDICDRGVQISEYCKAHEIVDYLVIDDLDLFIRECGHPFVQTNSETGLTDEDYHKITESFR